MDFEFVRYEPIVGDKHVGILTIKCWGKIRLRFKVVPLKDGTGFFASTGSVKGNAVQGKDTYVATHSLESNGDKEDLDAFMQANLPLWMNSGSQASPSSIGGPSIFNQGFAPPQAIWPAQQPANYQNYNPQQFAQPQQQYQQQNMGYPNQYSQPQQQPQSQFGQSPAQPVQEQLPF